MKKLATVFVLLALILSLAACGSAVSVGGISSKYFNDNDYNSRDTGTVPSSCPL